MDSSRGPSNEGQMAVLESWKLYGQRGKTPSHRVTPREWQSKPFNNPVSANWRITLEPHQLCLLLLGFCPSRNEEAGPAIPPMLLGDRLMNRRLMSTTANLSGNIIATEDKWFVYADGPDHKGEVRVHMFRSWTGIKWVELVIDAGFDGYGSTGDGAQVVKIYWDQEHGGSVKDQAPGEYFKEIAREVCEWVLDVKLGPEVLTEGGPRTG